MSEIKKAFVSRFPEGVLLNGDLSAIEMVWFAQLSRDRTLCDMINNNVDMHRYTYNKVYGTPIDDVTDKQRSMIKRVNFGIIYGNGAKTASLNSGLPEDECQEIIETFYKTFPNTRIWQNYNIGMVDRTGVLKLPTGLKIRFKQVVYIDNKKTTYDPMIHMKLNPMYARPDIKNYPVQHMAAVTMFLILGKFFRDYALHNRHKYLMINTVHDSLMLDCVNESVSTEAQNNVQNIIDKIPDYMLDLCNMRMAVPIRMSFSRGKTWYDLK